MTFTVFLRCARAVNTVEAVIVKPAEVDVLTLVAAVRVRTAAGARDVAGGLNVMLQVQYMRLIYQHE